MASMLEDFRHRLLRPHFVANVLMGPAFCVFLYWLADSPYSIEDELKLLAAMMLISVFKFRNAPTAEERLGGLALNLKLVAMYMAYTRKAWLTLTFLLVTWVLVFSLLPLPGYRGYSRIDVIVGLANLDDAIAATARSKSGAADRKAKQTDAGASSISPKAVVVMYAATWSPASRYFETTFAKLSLKYQSDQLRFVVFDVDGDPAVAERYSINTAASSTELPTVVLYRDGKERRRLPVRGEGTAARLAWSRSFASVVDAFELDSMTLGPATRPLQPIG